MSTQEDAIVIASNTDESDTATVPYSESQVLCTTETFDSESEDSEPANVDKRGEVTRNAFYTWVIRLPSHATVGDMRDVFVHNRRLVARFNSRVDDMLHSIRAYIYDRHTRFQIVWHDVDTECPKFGEAPHLHLLPNDISPGGLSTLALCADCAALFPSLD